MLPNDETPSIPLIRGKYDDFLDRGVGVEGDGFIFPQGVYDVLFEKSEPGRVRLDFINMNSDNKNLVIVPFFPKLNAFFVRFTGKNVQ